MIRMTTDRLKCDHAIDFVKPAEAKGDKAIIGTHCDPIQIRTIWPCGDDAAISLCGQLRWVKRCPVHLNSGGQLGVHPYGSDLVAGGKLARFRTSVRQETAENAPATISTRCIPVVSEHGGQFVVAVHGVSPRPTSEAVRRNDACDPLLVPPQSGGPHPSLINGT